MARLQRQKIKVLRSIFEISIKRFVEDERENIERDVSERNLCGRLSIILERNAHDNGFDRYFADVEYNRKQGGKIKTIMDDNMHVINITCDLILHSRGRLVRNDNLIAIEMKKIEHPEEEKEKDRNRLRAMTRSSFDDLWSADGVTHPEHVCGYQLGYLIVIDRNEQSLHISEYGKGEKVDEKLIKY